jgi:hypothetical protein
VTITTAAMVSRELLLSFMRAKTPSCGLVAD